MVKCNNYFIKSKNEFFFVRLFYILVLVIAEKNYFCSGKFEVLYNDKQKITSHQGIDDTLCL
jgi:hypothetical protein